MPAVTGSAHHAIKRRRSMSITSKVIVCLSFVVFFVCSIAFAGPSMPKELESEFTRYPGSVIVNATTSAMIVQVITACGSDSMDAVFEYYKEKASKNGWVVQVENASAESYNLMLQKENKIGMIAVGIEDGATSATLSIMNQ